MRDIQDGDRIIQDESGRLSLVHEYECESMTCTPMAWKDLQDYARWWLRQAELRPEIKAALSDQNFKTFEAILTLPPRGPQDAVREQVSP